MIDYECDQIEVLLLNGTLISYGYKEEQDGKRALYLLGSVGFREIRICEGKLSDWSNVKGFIIINI